MFWDRFIVAVACFCVSVPFVQNSGRVGSKLFYWCTRRKTYRNVNRGPVPLLFVLRFLCGMRVRKDTETRHAETWGISVHMVLSCFFIKSKISFLVRLGEGHISHAIVQ